MEFLKILYQEILGFFSFGGLIEIIESKQYDALLTQDGKGIKYAFFGACTLRITPPNT